MTVYNRLDYTKRTIQSLRETVPAGTQLVIVDDNSNEPGIKEYLDEISINVDMNNPTLVIHSEENVGFGAGVNTGLALCKTEMVLIANNDCIYEAGWYEKLLALYEKYDKIGILAVWKHTAHGLIPPGDLGDLVVKDQMPAVGWLMKRNVIDDLGAFPVHGPCHTKGGNGEDVTYCNMATQKGYWVCAPKEDVAQHIDGY